MRPAPVQNVRSSLATGLRLATLWLAASIASTAAAQTEADATARGAEPAYVERGHQTEARQKAYHERIDRFYQALSDTIRKSAPDLLAKLAPPPPDVYGYQIVPKLGADGAPPAPGTKSQVISYSWTWSDTLIARETRKLEQMESELAQAPGSAAGRASYEKLATDYRAIVDNRRPIDSDIQYNWTWQSQIAGNRPLFDRLKKIQDHVLEREALESAAATGDKAQLQAAATRWGLSSADSADSLRAALSERTRALTEEIVAANHFAYSRDVIRIDRPASNQWLLTVPVYTDIADAGFVEAFKSAVESLWRVRESGDDGTDEFQLRLEIHTISPAQLYCGGVDSTGAAAGCAPPARGEHIDVDAHVARFPTGGAVLTTGASAMRVIGDQALALGPYDVGPHVLAHEFGHVMGIPDAYFRGYRDAGTDGFVVTELADLSDIMGAPASGPVLARHFHTLIDVKARDALNLSQRLFQEQRYSESIDAARAALGFKPDFPEADNNLAAAYAAMGRWDEAIRAAEEALRLKPDFQLARNNLAWAQAEKARAGSSQPAK